MKFKKNDNTMILHYRTISEVSMKASTTSVARSEIVRSLLKSLPRKSTFLHVSYHRKGGLNTQYGTFQGICADYGYFALATDSNAATTIAMDEVVEIREIEIRCIAGLLNDPTNRQTDFLQSCPILYPAPKE